MEFLGIKMVAANQLYLPGNFRERLEAEHIPELAKSIDALDGCIHEPIVRKRDGKLIAGVDRIAAHFFLKRDMVRVKLVDCTDDEADRIEVDENFHRRHSAEERESLMARAQAIHERLPRIEYQGMGRPKHAKTVAREEVAMKLGISPESLRKQEQRRKRAKLQIQDPVRPLGMQLDADWRIKVAAAQKVMETDARHLKAMTTGIVRLLNSDETMVQKPRVRRLLELVQEAAELADELVPSSICPACKGLSELQSKCPTCFEAGYISKGQEEGIPQELWATDVVMTDGEVRPMSDFVEPIGEDFAVATEAKNGEEDWGF